MPRSHSWRRRRSFSLLDEGPTMSCRPSKIYRSLIPCVAFMGVIYLIYAIVAFDDGKHISHGHQKRLFITVSKDRAQSRLNSLAPKRIAMWTQIFSAWKPTYFSESECPGLGNRCVFYNATNPTVDEIRATDAFIFHARDVNANRIPMERTSNQRYVLYTMEAPHFSGLEELAKFPANFFNWTMSHSFNSDVRGKYGRYWITISEAESKGYKITENFYIKPDLLKKPKSGIIGFISNCQSVTNKRQNALEALSKHIDVTIGGACALNPKHRNLCPRGQDCDHFFAEYPFFLALENSNCNDYVTEKYWDRINYPSVMIVMRRKIYDNVKAPPNSFIAFDDYSSPSEMAEHLKYLQSNITAYAEYFEWRKHWTLAPYNVAGYRNSYCDLCDKLWSNASESSKSYPDVGKWLVEDGNCEKGEFTDEWIKNDTILSSNRVW